MLQELLREDSPISTLRLMGLVAIAAAVAIAFYGIYVGRDLMGLAALCSSFITPAFAAKVTQKIVESKSP